VVVERVKCARIAIEHGDDDNNCEREELTGRAPKVDDGSSNSLCLCAGLLDMQVQLLRQSADRRALLVVDVFSAKLHPLACSISCTLIVQMGALPAGMED
jgi:hypothetical protein